MRLHLRLHLRTEVRLSSKCEQTEFGTRTVRVDFLKQMQQIQRTSCENNMIHTYGQEFSNELRQFQYYLILLHFDNTSCVIFKPSFGNIKEGLM